MKKLIHSLLFLLILGSPMGCGGNKPQRERDPRQYVVVSRIYITCLENPHAPPHVTRTCDEARKLAYEAYEALKKHTLTFEEAVRKYSDDPYTDTRGGFLGPIRKGYAPWKIEEAVFALQKEGSITPVIEEGDSFYIFIREPWEYRGYLHILITHKEAEKVPLGITRSKEEAKALAQELLQRIKNGEAMEALAREYSNGMEKRRGGYLPIWSPKQLIPTLRSAWDLKVGEVTPVLASPFGFHILKRVEPLPEVIGIRHILISYTGASQAPLSLARTKDEARNKAESLRKKIKTLQDFEAMARKYSDDKSTRKKGGDVGLVSWDEMPFPVEDVAFRMPVGTISSVVESAGGFHILYRYQ